jgi:putative photosynthetic complex assembly protein
MVISVIATAWVSWTGSGPVTEVPTDVVASLDLRFVDQADGSLAVVDVADGETIETIEAGQNGFLRSTLRGLARARRAEGGSADAPFSLMQTSEGRLLLIDPVSGSQVDLWAFGSTNAGTFVRFLSVASDVSVPSSAATDNEPDTSTMTTAAFGNQEETP